MRRSARLLATAVAAAAPVLGVVAPAALSAAPAAASEQTVDSVRLNGYEGALAAKINNVRRSNGLRALVVVPGATDVARRWSWHLARAEVLSHNPNLVSALEHAGSGAWTEIAENVGEASSTDPGSLFSAYMASPPHKANILDPQARYLGVGVVERSGTAWNTLDFTNAYSTRYGRTHVPAPALTMDRQVITTATDVASLERPDQRFGSARAGHVSASLVHYTGPTSGNDSAYARLVRHGSLGHGDLLMNDALDLSGPDAQAAARRPQPDRPRGLRPRPAQPGLRRVGAGRRAAGGRRPALVQPHPAERRAHLPQLTRAPRDQPLPGLRRRLGPPRPARRPRRRLTRNLGCAVTLRD
jgi:uncharacterized protein YkwD